MPPKTKSGSNLQRNNSKNSRQSQHNIFQPKLTLQMGRQQNQEIQQQSSFTLDDQKQDDKLLNKAETIEKVLHRLGLQKNIKNKQNNQQLQQLVGNIVENCVGTIDLQTNLQMYQKIYNNQYKQSLKNKNKKSSIIVNELTDIQKIQMLSNEGIISIFKQIRLFLKKISLLCKAIVQHNLFESFILIIIIFNSIMMALDDPLTDSDRNVALENTFIVIYTLEMSIKIFAYGFLFNHRAYLRDLWNILDFVIVLTSLMPFFITIGFSVNSLRAIRVLRPLKTITKVKALKMIVSTLFYSFSLVMDSLYILFFVIIVFSIAGSQLFGGVLKNRCIQLSTGNVLEQLCTSTCSEGFVCGKGISSPNFSIQNFDTFFWSMLTVFQTLTLQGWSTIMVDLQKSYSMFAIIYSLLIIFFCEYVLLNMTMAILKYKYSQVKDNTIQEQQIQETDYQPIFLKKLGIFKNITSMPIEAPLQRYYSSDKIFVGAIQFNQNLDNSFKKCMEANFQAPPTTIKSLGRIKTINISKNKKIDISTIARGTKIQQFKWDAKTLQFETIQLHQNQQRDSLKNLKQQNEIQKDCQSNQNRNSIEEQKQSFSSNSVSFSSDECIKSIGGDDQRQSQLNQKIYEMQMKLNHSRKNITDEPIIISKSNKFIRNSQQKQKENKKKFFRPQLKEMNQAMQLIKNSIMSTKIQQKINKTSTSSIPIPHINFNDYKVDNLYDNFNDLGEFRVKRIQKVNQLNFFNIRQAKKYGKNLKKEQTNLSKEISQQNSLDIKQLQLVNELIKKNMRCRIKSKQQLDQHHSYKKSRVLVFQAKKQQSKKSQQLEQNMKNLMFNVTYKTSYEEEFDENSTIENNNGFIRNYQSQYKGLRITQIINKNQKQQRNKAQSVRNIIPKTANYLKLLQNHKMQEKIQFQQDKIMTIFFKKQKESKVSLPTKKHEQQYNSIKQADIFNRHGHIKITCPIQVNPDCEKQFLSSINIQDEQYQIYMKGIFGIFNVLRKKTLLFISKPFYDNLMLCLVLANTIVLSMNGLVDTSSSNFVTLNTIFTISFAVDLGLKLFSYGFQLFSDIMNIFDTFVVSISIVELAVGTVGNLSALRSVRILRAFRVLRITRLIRSLSYMKIVMSVVSSVITQFIYIFMLLALFILIYTLLGMQIFGGQFQPIQVTGVRQNFDTFFNAIFSVFQLLTVENWNDIETAVMTSQTRYFGIIYIISWIFIGNWILLNLLQAILLDGFDKDSTEQNTQQSEKQNMDLKTQLDDQEQSEQVSTQNQSKLRLKSNDASLHLFYPENFLRIISVNIIKSKIYENIIVVIIALSSIKLVMDTYIQSGTELQNISNILDYVFNSIFIFECVVKIIAQGFIIGENAYIKDSWSKLDFFIVLTSLIDMFVSIDLSILKLFRILRPLRIISRNIQMRIIITSLGHSMCGILNVMVIIVCVFIMFGILGINLLQDKLYYCNLQQNLVVNNYGPYNINRDNCTQLGGTWTNQFINFDNILNSLISLYVFSTRQNWPYYVFTFIDSSDNGPIKDQNQVLYLVFSVIFIFVCSYFFMDLLIGVLFMNFHESELKIKPKTLTDKQINWRNLQKIIIEQDPCFQLYLEPDNPFRKFFYNIITLKIFEVGITFCIICNILVMIIGQDDQSESKQNILNNINFAFSIVFFSEMTLKLFAFGKAYFLSGWNIFDFFVVIASILDIILGYAGIKNSQSSAFAILPQIARIFRVLRVTRLLRMFKRFKGLQKLIQTFIFSLPALGRGLSIISLFLFLCSVLASYLFNQINSDYSGNFDQYRNFANFHSSFQTLYIMNTGQNWYYYMFQSIYPGYVTCKGGGSGCVQLVYIIFWLPYIFLSQKVFMELFVLIVLDQFESNYIQQNNPLGIFALFEDDFRTNWIQITNKYNSQKIETKRLLDLILVLKQPLGMGKKQLMIKYEEQLRENQKLTEQQIQSSLKQLDLKLKKNGAKLIQKMDIIKNRLYLGYHETFYRFAKIALTPSYTQNATQVQKALLEDIHKQSQEKLVQLMPVGNNFQFQQGQQINNQPLNPIQLILFSQMIVKSWHNYSLKFHSQKHKNLNKAQVNESLNNSCSSDVVQAELQKLPIERKIHKRKGMLEVGRLSQASYQFKVMPNTDDHYQNEKKRAKKGHNSSYGKGFKVVTSVSNGMNRLASCQDKKTQID